ncbi:DNA repair protein RecN [Micrococcoides hystricis]|uniref:DNA repair protein RecN n=1 Tax=Micrococcoides hystricis TaxID=1572761 RepID=A0ABV6P7H9_9MICC
MIEEINIQQLGVIESATLPLSEGFTVVTGETGAGKTMVVTALGLLLGQRADSGAVRHGENSASVDTRYVLPKITDRLAQLLEEQDAVLEEHDGGADLLVSRTVYVNGRSRATVGGRQAPAGILQEIGRELVAVHGQTDQLRLTSAQAQREALDQFAGAKLRDKLETYQEQFEQWRHSAQILAELTSNVRERTLEADGLRQALADIDEVQPLSGEDEELKATLRRLENVEGLRSAAAIAQMALIGGDDAGVESPSVASLIQHAESELGAVSDEDEQLQQLAQRLQELSILSSDLGSELGAYLSSLDMDDLESLGAVHERIAELNRITRKYGEHGNSTLDDIIAWADQARTRLADLDVSDERIEQLQAETQRLDDAVNESAQELSAIRTRAAAELADAVSKELQALSMPDARLVVDVTPAQERTRYGQDEITIQLQPHSGAGPRPLAKGASGGELSRVMLAIEVVLATKNPVPTMIFDEVDAGVGGQAAVEIGRRLAKLAQHTQVIVVTHLPQVAAFADHHIRVLKATDTQAAVTSSDVGPLNAEERVLELARMLSGHQDSSSAQEHARELLASSHT